jgi:hypothetical protein
MRWIRGTVALAPLALLVACEALAPVEPTALPVPTLEIVALPSDTAEPPPSPSPPPATPDLLATVIAGATSQALLTQAAAQSPGSAGGPPGQVLPGCDIPLAHESWVLAPEAPAADWPDAAQHSVTARVVEHLEAERRYVLQPAEPADAPPLRLSYDGAPLPLSPGASYRFTAWADRPGDPPAGYGLRVDDEAGPVFLGVSLREAADADARVLGGDRAGFTVQQLPTQCGHTLVTACGVELRAAPVAVGGTAGRVTLGSGRSAELPTLPGASPYRITVLASHHRRPVVDTACPDPTDWVLSYRIERQAGGTPTASP